MSAEPLAAMLSRAVLVALAGIGGPARSRHASIRGAATVEFYLLAVFALIPLSMAILELSSLSIARHALNHATFLAARAGAMHHGSTGVMRRQLARGLAPLFAGAPDDGALAAAGGEAFARALVEVARPDLTRIEILNPTRASFADFERLQEGIRQIPNDNLRFRSQAGARSGQTIQEANLLRIRVRWCRRLFFPLIDRMITATLRPLTADAFAQGCYARERVPIGSYALVHMQSAPRRAEMGL